MGKRNKGPWKDDVLRRLAKRGVAFPLAVSEMTFERLRRKTFWTLGLLVGGCFLALVALFAWAGVLPGFVTAPGFTGDQSTFVLVLFGLPAGAGLLVWVLIRPRVQRRPDEADHPWRFSMTAEGLTIASATGRTLSGPWSGWRYRGYQYVTVRSSRMPTALLIGQDAEEITVIFSRFTLRDGGQVIRGLLQGLASAGQTDA